LVNPNPFYLVKTKRLLVAWRLSCFLLEIAGTDWPLAFAADLLIAGRTLVDMRISHFFAKVAPKIRSAIGRRLKLAGASHQFGSAAALFGFRHIMSSVVVWIIRERTARLVLSYIFFTYRSRRISEFDKF